MSNQKTSTFICYDNEIKEVVYCLINALIWFQADPMSTQRWHVTVKKESGYFLKNTRLVEVA